MTEIVLLRPEYLWALPVALIGVLAWRTVRRRPFVAFPMLGLLAPRVFRASRLRQAPVVLAAASLPLIALALGDPVRPYGETELKSRGLDIVLVLDLSSSMEEIMGADEPATTLGTETRAIAPGRAGAAGETRLDTTKRAVVDFIARRPGDRIGLVVFSDNAYVVSPLTFDHRHLRQYVAMIDDKILRGEGMTAIGDGMALASALLARQSAGGAAGNRLMVVFTDGEHNYGADPIAVLDQADTAGIRVHLVGVDLETSLKTKPEVLGLISAVRRHGGRYFNADTARQLRAASVSIDALEKGWLVQRRTTRNEPAYQTFAIWAVVLVLAALVLRAVPHFVDVT